MLRVGVRVKKKGGWGRERPSLPDHSAAMLGVRVQPWVADVMGYMLVSSLLLVCNKVVLVHWGAPFFLLFLQLGGTAVAVLAAGALGLAERQPLSWRELRTFVPAAGIFLATVALNAKALQHSNVDTFMLFRFSTPMGVALGDYCCLGRELPSLRSWAALVGLAAGAVGFVATDATFDPTGYGYCLAWYLVFCLDQLYLKRVCEATLKLGTWTRVYYCNALAAPLVLLCAAALEVAPVAAGAARWRELAPATAASVGLALAMSYFAWAARAALSATSFTVCGNVCKVVTLAINYAMWSRHAGPAGAGCLAGSLLCTTLYRQAPLREPPSRPHDPGEARPLRDISPDDAA